MLRIYPVILDFVTEVAGSVERIARHDPDLAKQLRRASAKVVLNTAEGMYARGRQRSASYNIALREMRESYAALEVSVRLRYIAPLPAELEHRIAHILGTPPAGVIPSPIPLTAAPLPLPLPTTLPLPKPRPFPLGPTRKCDE